MEEYKSQFSVKEIDQHLNDKVIINLVMQNITTGITTGDKVFKHITGTQYDDGVLLDDKNLPFSDNTNYIILKYGNSPIIKLLVTYITKTATAYQYYFIGFATKMVFQGYIKFENNEYRFYIMNTDNITKTTTNQIINELMI